MKKNQRFLAMLAGVAALSVYMVPDARAERLKRDVGPNSNPAYEKQCGGCHFPHQPGWLPERSWRSLMDSMGSHFGESIALAPAARDDILGYLVANAADKQFSLRSVQVVASIKAGDTPKAVSQVPYVAGIHGGFLDPAYRAQPQLKTLANCSACHTRAADGVFSAVQYTVSDESFRGQGDTSYADVLTPSERLALRKK